MSYGATPLYENDAGFRVLEVKEFVSKAEADELLALAEPIWQRSKTDGGASVARTSDTASFRGELAERPCVAEVMRRAAALAGFPADHCETLQLVPKRCC